jgi:hypothetical protein
MATVTEDTIEAEISQGIRRFVIEEGDSQIIIQVRQTARESCDGEIHSGDGFAHSNQPVTNQQLTFALIQMASAAVNSPKRQSL